MELSTRKSRFGYSVMCINRKGHWYADSEFEEKYRETFSNLLTSLGEEHIG